MAGHILKIMLENTHPPVWRRVIVPEMITFGELHEIIQILFGWEGEHLHDFSRPSEYIRITDAGNMWGSDDYEEDKTLVDAFFSGYKWIRYTYDFGDEWRHKIIYEKKDESYDKRFASLLKFKGDNFMEDCGGVWGSDDARVEFDREMTERRLEKFICPVHDELPIYPELHDVFRNAEESLNRIIESIKYNLERHGEKKKAPKELSDMTKKIERWRNCAEDYEVEIAKGSRTHAQLLGDLGMQEAKDYCKYLQIPTRSSDSKTKLTELAAQELERHPEYFLYVLYEKEYKELARWIDSPGEMKKGAFTHSDIVIKALCLGLMDVEVCEETEKQCVRLSFAGDIRELLKPLDKKYCKQVYRRIQKLSKDMNCFIQFYCVLEFESFYELFCKASKEEIEREEFYRFIYWHKRFNDQIDTVYSIDGKSYLAVGQLDLDRIISDMKKYAEDLNYKYYPLRTLAASAEDISMRSAWLDGIFVTLHYQMGFPEDIAGGIVEDVFEYIMDGHSLPELLRELYLLNPDLELSVRCELWGDVAGLMLEMELPMLKGRSRTEYAEQKGMSPWQVGMTEQEDTLENSPTLHMYEFPLQIQEMMYLACSDAGARELKRLHRYKVENHIRSEEFLFLLADAYITGSEFSEAEKVIEELEAGSSYTSQAVEILKANMERGQELEDEDYYDVPFLDGFDPEEEYKQQPYIRETRKIGRNEPCPCGSGKKYKHCCGK